MNDLAGSLEQLSVGVYIHSIQFHLYSIKKKHLYRNSAVGHAGVLKVAYKVMKVEIGSMLHSQGVHECS